MAGTVAHLDLAVAAARRGYDAAVALERPDLIGFMAMGRTMTLGRVGARHRALRVADRVLVELPTGPVRDDTRATEARGMLHLSATLTSVRGGAVGDARAWAQTDGDRDGAVVRALDMADRLAPIRVRSDPIARDLVVDLHRRAKRKLWELDSLRNRLGMA